MSSFIILFMLGSWFVYECHVYGAKSSARKLGLRRLHDRLRLDMRVDNLPDFETFSEPTADCGWVDSFFKKPYLEQVLHAQSFPPEWSQGLSREALATGVADRVYDAGLKEFNSFARQRRSDEEAWERVTGRVRSERGSAP